MTNIQTYPDPNWAYAGFTMNSEPLGIGTVYYGGAYLTSGGAVYDPNTNASYQADRLAVIVNGAAPGAEGYRFDLPAKAVLGVSAFGTGKCFWYDADSAAAILSHTDPLALNGETGTMTTTGGETAALPM